MAGRPAEGLDLQDLLPVPLQLLPVGPQVGGVAVLAPPQHVAVVEAGEGAVVEAVEGAVAGEGAARQPAVVHRGGVRRVDWQQGGPDVLRLLLLLLVVDDIDNLVGLGLFVGDARRGGGHGTEDRGLAAVQQEGWPWERLWDGRRRTADLYRALGDPQAT